MKTPDEYAASVRGLPKAVYLLGERVDDATAHPILRPSLNALAETYAAADEGEPLARRFSPLTGGEVSAFTSIHGSNADLVAKIRLQRLLGRRTGCCFQRCVGWDALNALHIATFEADRKQGTSYHGRLLDYVRFVQENDLVLNGAMTDVKGDRSRRPGDQADADMYLRVVDRRSGGIVVRGAKAHQTGAVFSHEIVALPTAALRPNEADYAVAFAVPVDTPGITHIVGRQSCDTRKLEGGDLDVGNARYGGHEALVIFDDVLVPWERVFLCGESEFAGRLVECFAAYHRQSYGGCKPGVGDVLIGAAALAAELTGVEQAGHVRRKLAEMVHLNETLYAGGIACSHLGAAAPSGAYLVDLLLANVCKLNVTRHPYEIARLAEDIAGGLLVTMPSEKDWRNPALQPLMDKYLRGAASAPTETRLRVLRLIENMTMGTCAAAYRTESLHGAGSPEAQVVMIGRLAGYEEKKGLARRLAGVE